MRFKSHFHLVVRLHTRKFKKPKIRSGNFFPIVVSRLRNVLVLTDLNETEKSFSFI